MTGCLARRAQTAASAAVVVISSMNGPYAFGRGVLPKALICQGSCGKFEPCNYGWQHLFDRFCGQRRTQCGPDPAKTARLGKATVISRGRAGRAAAAARG